MKALKLCAIIAGLALSAFTSQLSAQQALNNWLNKCENIKTVDFSVINYKNPDTKKEERKTMKVSFSNNDALLKELLAAFEKDKKDAYTISEKRTDGMTRPDFCTFKINGFDAKYMFEFKKNGQVIVTALFYYVELVGG